MTRRIETGRTQIRTKKQTCVTIKMSLQIKIIGTWITLHRYEIEQWYQNIN
jgi:hypothetical protein